MSKTISPNQIITDQEFQEFAKAIMEHKEHKSETLASVYAQDRDDLFSILEHCMRGNKQVASKLACSLDTLVREIIPDSVWRTLVGE